MKPDPVRDSFELHAIAIPAGQVFEWAEQLAGIHSNIKNAPIPANDTLPEVLDDVRYDTLLMRGHELAGYVGPIDTQSNEEMIEAAIRRLLVDEDGALVDVKVFENKLSQIYGAVTTGHPVFGMHPELAGTLSKYYTAVAEKNGDDVVIASLEADLRDKMVLKHQPPTLKDEREQSYVALKNLSEAARTVERIAIKVAREAYPDQWETINYNPMSIATWIPFDWDGRKDVKWYDLMRERILLQTTKFQDEILPEFESLRDTLPSEVDASKLDHAIGKIIHTLEVMNDQYDFYDSYDQKQDGNLMKLQAKAAEMVANTGERITHPKILIEALDDLLGHDLPEEMRAGIVLMRSRLMNHGITMAHPHFRINSASVKAALSQHEHGGASIDQNEYEIALDDVSLPLISNMLLEAEETETHMGNLAAATESIMQQMIFIRQVKDHIDSHSSNRFLIAEAHNATIVLAALYFAKKTGTESHVDISPLFEDAMGVDNAAEIVEKLLKNESYVEYLKRNTEAQYRMGQWICMQFGYSDVSRFDGTIQSGAFTEKAKGQISKAIKNAGLQDTALGNVVFVSFDTHGDGIGRGKNPVSFKDRLKYLSTLFFNRFVNRNGQGLKFEESFQGQDGFMMLGTAQAALNVVAQTLDHITSGSESDIGRDPIYTTYKSESRAFFKTARQAHNALAHSTENALLIDIFKNFLPQTGSRPVKRDQQTGGKRDLPRAIQHNGSLQQLGLLSTVTYGIGQAIRNHPGQFETLMENSPEFRSRMAAVYHVMDIADPEIMEGYIQLYNPDYWRAKARQVQDPERKRRFFDIGERVRKLDYYRDLSAVVAKMRDDFDVIKEKREELDRDDDPMKDEKYRASVSMKHYNMRIAHGARFKACIDLFEKAVQIPGFSNRNDVDRGGMIDRILRFDIHAIEDLNEIFGSAPAYPRGPLDELKPSGLDSDETDYSGSHRNIIRPMRDSLDIIRNRASGPIMDIYCAVG